MNIAEVEAFAIRARPVDRRPYWGSRAWGAEEKSRPEISVEYPVPLRRRYIYSTTIDTVIIKIVTGTGLIGYGECKAPVAPEATARIVQLLLAPMLIGADPREIAVLWDRMYAGMRVRGHRAGFYLEAISGVDIALWDLAGKIWGEPVSTLLGGSYRQSTRVYASGLPALPRDAPAEAFTALADEASALAAKGYTGLKMALGRGIEGDLRSVRAVRERMGQDFLIYADAAGVYDRAQALRLGRAFEELGVGFFEMPIAPEDVEGYAQLAQSLDIPIALDSIASRHETVELIRNRAIDLVQPDVCRAGGITECRRIAEIADAFGLAFAPHVSIGSAIHFAASAHLASAMPNTMTCEYWIGDNPLGNAVLEEPLVMQDGYLYSPTGPGLGLRIREAALLAEAVSI